VPDEQIITDKKTACLVLHLLQVIGAENISINRVQETQIPLAFLSSLSGIESSNYSQQNALFCCSLHGEQFALDINDPG
jgi:hypothetical protein